MSTLITALFIGGFIVSKNASPNTSAQNTVRSVNSDTATNATKSIESETYKIWVAMTGEQYDRNYIANMIAHHEGAVEMAKLALANAKHTEVKNMANTIIDKQQTDIYSMLLWQQQWDYPSSSGVDMQDHSAMGMMNSNANMTTKLKPLKGEAFDKEFISLMIEHHQEAVDMSRPGETNALHQEVKHLAKAIYTTQSNEITQMKQWKTDWGY